MTTILGCPEVTSTQPSQIPEVSQDLPADARWALIKKLKKSGMKTKASVETGDEFWALKKSKVTVPMEN